MTEVSLQSRQKAREIYEEHKELIEADIAFGAPLHMRIARTVKEVAGL
ncbi:hypothetical protein [Methanolobus sp. ZRKC5]